MKISVWREVELEVCVDFNDPEYGSGLVINSVTFQGHEVDMTSKEIDLLYAEVEERLKEGDA